jgi:multidrug efflux pump subunit AcrB
MSLQDSSPKQSWNISRYFVHHPQVAWVLLVTVVLAGVLGYWGMPKRKDPEIPVRVAVAAVAWPGARAELVEQAITRKLEAKIAENEHVDKIESTTRTGVSIVRITLTPDVENTNQEFDDISARINTIQNWPKGATTPQFMKDFGSTVALMLTIASPSTPDLEVSLRARAIREHIEAMHRDRGLSQAKDIVFAFPSSVESSRLLPIIETLQRRLEKQASISDAALSSADGFVVVAVNSKLDANALESDTNRILDVVLPEGERHPDLWAPFVVSSPNEVENGLKRVVGPRYTYKELDDFSERLQHRLQRVPQVSKVSRVGLRPEQFTLDYSQEKLASAGVTLESVAMAVMGQNVNLPGGEIDVGGRNVTIRTSGEIGGDHELQNVFVTSTSGGTPVRLRELFDVAREYQAPRLMNSYGWYDSAGAFRSSRAITLAISMRSGEQVAKFGTAVDAALNELRALMPQDLVIARTSDQPQQVSESVALFNNSLYEAIVLVVLVALIGFLSWRTATILALAIPVTLAMTYAVMRLIGWDLQQISISTMILALGLLVDVPVVASDAIVSGIAHGEPTEEASWKGPTRLSVAILFATITNVVAYLPFLSLPGDIGRFIRSLPVVMTIALLAAWLLSLTFVPVLGAALLRAPKRHQPTIAERRQRGFGRVYSNVVTWSIRHRWISLAVAVALALSALPWMRQLKTAFFPKDLSYLSYVDVWAPEDSTVSQTRELAERAQGVIREAAERWGREHPDEHSHSILKSVTTFVGGGGPRFWFSVTPEQQQPNYAQLVIQVNDKHDTNRIVGPLQKALDTIAGARIDVRQLEMAKPVGIPVSIRISGEDIPTLKGYGKQVRQILNRVPIAERVRDDWGSEGLSIDLNVDADRAALANVTHQDVANSSAAGHGGALLGAIREDDTLIPIFARLRSNERSDLSDIGNLYVSAARTGQKVPLAQVADSRLKLVLNKIARRNHERTMTVSCFPADGHLPSEVMTAAGPAIENLRKELVPGFQLEIGGEQEEQKKGFNNLVVVLVISVICIYVALALQFKSAVKPLIVFATIPFGAVGALVSLRITSSPFGFMAFLGIISLIGVIVSHVIVLFDFIEERRNEGAELEEALVDAGIQRLRPVLITVLATVIALFPLALHGGPLWEPLCYAQIGGLSIATFITLLIVPIVYATFVRDLHWLH